MQAKTRPDNISEFAPDLLKGAPLPLIANLAAPNTLASATQATVGMTEVWIIGQLGTTPLAALALAFPLLMLMQTMSGGATGGAVASSVARALGSRDREKAERLIWHALALSVVGALLFLIVFLLAGRPFLVFLGGEGAVVEQAFAYCMVLFAGGLFVWLMGTGSAIYRGMGDMQFPARMMLASAFLQIPLTALLVSGLFGLPQLGMTGAAIAAVVSSLVFSLVMLLKLAFGNTLIKLRWSACTFSIPLAADILKVALPATLSPLVSVTIMLSLAAVVGYFGEAALAGYGISVRVEFLLTVLIFGIGAAMTSLVGMSVGAHNIARAERIGFVGGTLAAVIAGAIGLVLAIFPDSWISLFTDQPDVRDSARSYIQIVGPLFFFQGVGFSLYFASQGAGRMFWPMTASLLRVVIVVGGAVFVVHMVGLGLTAVYWAAAIGMLVYGLVTAAAVRLGAWR